MVYSLLLVLMVLAVLAMAGLGALILIGLAIYRSQKKTNGNMPGPAKDLDTQQADEITATWNLLNH